MSETKVIYDSGESSCTVNYDGEMVIIKQELEGSSTGEIHIYEDELKNIMDFVNQTKQHF